MTELERAYEECRSIARNEAKNFYYAFITLPTKRRMAIYAAYAFCRRCDDATDEEMPVGEKLRLLAELRKKLSLAYSESPSGPLFTALADASGSFDIPEEYFQDIVSGVETDLTKTRYQSFEELRDYCYKVASVVGLVCIQVLGYSNPKAKEYAVDLGMAMQLTNILRDLKEDMERDRVYLPLDEIERFGYSVEELEGGVVNEQFLQLMSFQADRARRYFDSGFNLLPYLSPRSRACPAVLAELYRHILTRIERRGFNVFEERVHLSRREKYFVTARTWVRSLLPMEKVSS